jgi:tRNA(fMet)-specific endonuclease VapC
MNNFPLIYLLDTNACIVYLKNKNSRINRRLDSIEANKIAVCSVVKAELFYGSMRSNNSQKSLNIQQLFLYQFVSLPFDDSYAEDMVRFGLMRANAGTPIGRVSASNFVVLDTDKKLKTLSEYQFFIQNRTNCRK